jgi:hypothetical protein
MTEPSAIEAPRAGLNQIVKGLEITTNYQRVRGDPGKNTASLALRNGYPRAKKFAIWEFNAMFDRITCNKTAPNFSLDKVNID